LRYLATIALYRTRQNADAAIGNFYEDPKAALPSPLLASLLEPFPVFIRPVFAPASIFERFERSAGRRSIQEIDGVR